MGAVQVVSSYENDNLQTVQTNVDYTVDKSHDVIISTFAGSLTLKLPPNPDIGESHRFVSNTGPGETIVLDGNGANIQVGDNAPGPTAIVPKATIVDIIWTGTFWIPTCCAEVEDQPPT